MQTSPVGKAERLEQSRHDAHAQHVNPADVTGFTHVARDEHDERTDEEAPEDAT